MQNIITKSVCPQCQNIISSPSNRLVQDNCGHSKCRSCLLNDTECCKQCSDNNCQLNNKKSNLLNYVSDDSIELNNYTGVICNNVKLSQVSKEEEEIFKVPDQIIVEKNICTAKPDNLNIILKENNVNSKKHKNIIIVPEHIKMQTDPIGYLCTICNKTFNTKGHIKYHKYCNGEIKPFKCEICSKDFILKVQYQIHMWKHSNTKPFKCSVCSKSFSERSKLTRHFALHSARKEYICTICAKGFKIKDSLRIHSLIHKNEKKFSCNLCKAAFNNSSNLKKHIVSHSNEKQHMCDQCGKRFKLKWALSVHRKAHLNIRPFLCNICSKSFIYLKDLQRHKLNHSDTKLYSCSICLANFRRKDILRRHMKNTHPGKEGEIIKNPMPILDSPPKKTSPSSSVVIENPNAVNVITASPAINKSKADSLLLDVVVPSLQQSTTLLSSSTNNNSRPSSVINGPIKLAFKTPAFKSYYNITRRSELLSSPQFTKNNNSTTLDLVQSSSSTITTNNVHQQDAVSSPSLHYETCFQNQKDALIKNIKFKVPAQYTNFSKLSTNNNNNIRNNVDDEDENLSENTNNSSVIVNVNSDVHWRRRTSQNLMQKN